MHGKGGGGGGGRVCFKCSGRQRHESKNALVCARGLRVATMPVDGLKIKIIKYPKIGHNLKSVSIQSSPHSIHLYQRFSVPLCSIFLNRNLTIVSPKQWQVLNGYVYIGLYR